VNQNRVSGVHKMRVYDGHLPKIFSENTLKKIKLQAIKLYKEGNDFRRIGPLWGV
jgi:hypothetical protein